MIEYPTELYRGTFFFIDMKIKLEQLLSAHRLDIARNFIPPCFKVPATNEKPDGYLQQSGISEKNIADSVEALIGVYLLTTGTKGAMAFLNWIGLKTFPEEGENRDVNPTNGFPIIDFSPSTLPLDKREEMIAFLFTGLESLEAKIHYTFKNKALLIEALTHASFYPNRFSFDFAFKFTFIQYLLLLVNTFFYYTVQYTITLHLPLLILNCTRNSFIINYILRFQY